MNYQCYRTCDNNTNPDAHPIRTQALELDKHFSALKTLSKESPELAKIVSDLENGLETGAAKARELQVLQIKETNVTTLVRFFAQFISIVFFAFNIRVPK